MERCSWQSAGPHGEWPEGQGERIYIDLDARHPAIGPLIEVLARLGLPTLLQGSGMTEALAAEIAKPTCESPRAATVRR